MFRDDPFTDEQEEKQFHNTYIFSLQGELAEIQEQIRYRLYGNDLMFGYSYFGEFNFDGFEHPEPKLTPTDLGAHATDRELTRAHRIDRLLFKHKHRLWEMLPEEERLKKRVPELWVMFDDYATAKKTAEKVSKAMKESIAKSIDRSAFSPKATKKPEPYYQKHNKKPWQRRK
jgi:hypothetical protein